MANLITMVDTHSNIANEFSKGHYALKLIIMFISVILMINMAFGQQPQLTDEQQQLKQQFTNLNGQNRTAVFAQLQKFIKTTSFEVNAVESTQEIGINTTTLSEVIMLLGEPNAKRGERILIYQLNPSSGCECIIVVSANQEVEYCKLNNCQ